MTASSRFLVVLATACAVAAVALGVPKTVSSLNVAEFMGPWIEMYASPTVKDTFEFGAVCVRAEYTVHAPNNVTVFNQQRFLSVNGTLETILGWAFIPDASQPGQLKVVFETPRYAESDYWALALGPVRNGYYDWAIMSDPLQLTLWVLTRDPKYFNQHYNTTVMATVEQLGFTNAFNHPIPTLQAGCVYVNQP